MPFLSQLKKNNSREWMEQHRKDYEKAKADFLEFSNLLIQSIADFDASVGNLHAKNCVFRINRDVRFSKDKSPYKTNMGVYINKNGKKGLGPGYYFHVEPGNIFIAVGIWMPEPEIVAKIRQEIDYEWKEWQKILSGASLKKHFPNGMDRSDTLVRAPKGYEEENPAIEHIKLKSFILRRTVGNDELKEIRFLDALTKCYQSTRLMMQFLEKAIDG